jgi:hypothetical protein
MDTGTVVTGAAVIVTGITVDDGVDGPFSAAGADTPPLMIHARPTEMIRIPRIKKTEELFIRMVLSGVG